MDSDNGHPRRIIFVRKCPRVCFGPKNVPRIIFHKGMSRGISGWNIWIKWIPCRITSLRIAVVICAILVNTQTDTKTSSF